MKEFPAAEPISTDIHANGGVVTVIAEERTTATVDVQPYDSSEASTEAATNTRVEMRGSTLVVETPENKGWSFRWGRAWRVRIEVRIPLDSTVSARVSSADVICHGRLMALTAHTASGDVRADETTGDVTINTASGDVRIGNCGGDLRVNTASGDLNAGVIGGDATVHAASGDIEIQAVGASAKVNTASGDVRLGAARQGQVKINSASGDVSVGVRAGTGVWLDITTMSGSTSSDLNHAAGDAPASGAELSLQIRTMSGDIDIRRVAA